LATLPPQSGVRKGMRATFLPGLDAGRPEHTGIFLRLR
jgi:hypothetical protein